MYVKQLPVQPKRNGCLCCPDPQLHADLDMVIAVGFGAAFVTRDGELFYDGEMALQDGEEPKRLRDIEEAAKLEPTCDWRLVMHAPLHGEEYQRHDDTGHWTCIKANEGFA